MPLIDFVCPRTHSALQRRGDSLVGENGVAYPIVADVPRFVERSNYADSFGLQWNQFQATQLDAGAVTQSSDRLWAETGWDRRKMHGKIVLEVGSGAGRFTRALLADSDASVMSVDLSEAVVANTKNNSQFIAEGRLAIAQASIYELPFADNSFEQVICFGVLQHTPDFRRSLACLFAKVRPGGELVVDFYAINGWWTKIHAKYLLRPITKRLPAKTLLKLVRTLAPPMIPVHRALSAVGLGALTRFVPICGLSTLPAGLTKEELKEWVVLDTFDVFSPAYDNPQRITTVAKWLTELGAKVTFAGLVRYGGNRAAVVRATKL